MSPRGLPGLYADRRRTLAAWLEAGPVADDPGSEETGRLMEVLTRIDRLLREILGRAAAGVGLLADEVVAGEAFGGQAAEEGAIEELVAAEAASDWTTVVRIGARLQAGQDLIWDRLGGRPQQAMRGSPPEQTGPFLGWEMEDAGPEVDDDPHGPSDFPGVDVVSFGPPVDEVETLERTPHMDLSAAPPLRPGSELTLTVWTDREAARGGETVEGISIAAPSSIRSFDLELRLLTSAHFEVVEKPSGPLTLTRGQDASDRLRFQVRVKAAGELRDLAERDEVVSPSRGYLSVTFRYQSRPAGKVTRLVDLELPAAAAADRPPPPRPLPRPAVAFDVVDGEPDLTVQIVADPMEPDRRFHCLLETPHLELSGDEAEGRWTLRQSTSEIVASYMELFTAKGKQDSQRLAALKGAGRKLFDGSPKNFQTVYWRLLDEHGPIHTVALVTEEPHYPWELMIARRRKPEGGFETRDPLGVEAAVGRFIHGLSLSGDRRWVLTDSYAIAPSYRGSRELPHAQVEAELVTELFPGESIRPVTFDRLDAALSGRPASLIHFACHGKQTSGVQQSIYLDDDVELSSVEVAGMDGFASAFEAGRPLVFLNACEVGRLEPALAAVGGFASTFIELGARAVIAPLWSVKDTLAHEVAKAFYHEVKDNPDVPLSEIFRRLRQRSYEGTDAGEDTYAAYCFYGDPLATVVA